MMIIIKNIKATNVVKFGKFTKNLGYFNLRGIVYSRNYSEVTNRQSIFENNYNSIKDILKDGDKIGKFKTQKDVEMFLYNQELKLLNIREPSSSISFTNETYEVLISRKELLDKLLSKASFKRLSKRSKKDNSKIWVSKILDEIGVDKISSLLLGFFMEIITKENILINDTYSPGIPTITAYEKFGKKLLNKYTFSLYIRSNSHKNGDSLNLFKINNESLFEDIYDDTFTAKLGGHFMGALFEVDLIYEDLDFKVDNKKEKENYIRIYPDMKKIFLNNNNKYIHIPPKLPMICEPKDFVYSPDVKSIKLGGYLLNGVNFTDYIFKDKKGYEKDTELLENNLVVSLINGLSKVPYKINMDTLNFIRLYGLEKNVLIDDTDKNLQKFIVNSYRNSFSKKDNNKYRSIYSKLILEKNIIGIADCYSTIDKIYFPIRLDKRTRLYCETDYFDYQKSELAKGLISLAVPGFITKVDDEAIKYFKCYGANMYGGNLEKKSLNKRVEWIDENKETLLNFRDNNIVNSAENKACFISFCFEYERFIKFMSDYDKSYFYSYLPIQLDASCNGYQHLALLTKETNLFDKLNLAESSKDDSPDDFYQYILDKTKSYIDQQIVCISNKKEKTDKQVKSLNSLILLSKINFDRSIVKKTIMTKSYGASIVKQVQNIVKNLQEFFENKDKDKDKKYKRRYYIYKDYSIKIKREDILEFVMALKTVLEVESPKIKQLSKYLDDIVKICTKLGMPVPWTLPSGAVIKESYQKHEEMSIKAFSFSKTRYTFKKYIKGEFDFRKQKRATMPNLIHSLDATTIALLYNELKNKGINMYTVHDCFATTANYIPTLINALKFVYIKMYSDNEYLLKFDNFIKITLNEIFGDRVYKLNDKHVYVHHKTKTEVLEYPDINKVIDVKSFEKEKIKNLIKSSYTLN